MDASSRLPESRWGWLGEANEKAIKKPTKKVG